jgi:hypothetical protein
MFRKLALIPLSARLSWRRLPRPPGAWAASMAIMATMAMVMAVDGAIGTLAGATAPGGATGTPTSATSNDRQGRVGTFSDPPAIGSNRITRFSTLTFAC